ncbi:hypothetical protein SEA_ANNADREAMY_226 [Streptomyces phage Annadreamy]|uniref:Uncharacterized protein n=2 Tax=Annadreamyvirus annadreamy TaxID=2846392 RepID=A0A345GTS8_9CAUD|nr:hypothetical protein HWB75_gp052 [Streptomyces phage Annadreamy]AXG66350.1 hypothetical protein SEA_ANNADREAMY_226 [Streptomyces phage Annadreamy]QGH79534.1 hypothetical protein SEA_LIMPID_233 [Streptomyces phage Limpid]
MKHYKHVCKCGKLIAQCRCPGDKEVQVSTTCEHKDWTQALEDELSEEYNVPANSVGQIVKYVEVEIPATRHSLDIRNHSLYGFIITLYIADETGGVMVEKELYIGVKESDLADTVHSLYTSYE